MRNALAAFIVSFALLGWGSACGWSQAGEVVGRVNLISGGDPGVVVVQLEDLRGSPLATVFTDEKGLFRIQGLGRLGDNLFLVIEHEGFRPVREEIDLGLRQSANMMIFLEPETDPGAGDRLGVVDVRELLANIPDEAVEAYERALEASLDGDHAEAIEHLENALELAPDYYEAWIKLGGEHLEIDQFREAEAAFEQAFRLSPNGAVAPLNMGVLYYKEGDLQAIGGNLEEAAISFQRAIGFLQEAIRLNPVSSDAFFYLGATLYKSGLFDDAEQLLQRTLDIANGHAQARLTLINLYARQSRYEEALEQADAFLEENADSPQRAAIERVKSQIEAALGR